MDSRNAVIAGGGYHHVAIRASDFDATLRFYCAALGYRVAVRWGQGDGRAALLNTGDGNYLEVFAGGKHAPGEPPPEGAILHYALRTTNCDAALEQARTAGATVTMEPKTLALESEPKITIRIAFCKGLDGELIEFFQNDQT